MSKNLIYTANTTEAVVPAGSTVSVGSIIRRYGLIGASGSAINLVESGYYSVDIHGTFTAAATGDVVFTLLQDGVPVPGATATATIATAATEYKDVYIGPVIRVRCCGNSNLSVMVSSLSTSEPTIVNFTWKVIKV